MRTLCYVASPSYSGSTLLTFLLGTHPRIATVGELKGRLYRSLDVPKRCSCGAAVPECPFWQEAARRLGARGVSCDLHDIDTYFHAPRNAGIDRLLRARVRGGAFEALRALALRLWPGARRELERLLARNQAIVEVICELQGGDVLLDSSKDAVRLKFLLDSGRFRVKVIQLVRDGRGTANSYMKRDGFPMSLAAARFRSAHESYRALFAALPPNDVHRLHYEALCRDPRAALNGVLDFLDLERDRLDLEFMSSVHHVFGNPMRLASSSEIALDEAWREELAPDDLATFERIAGACNRAFGYAP